MTEPYATIRTPDLAPIEFEDAERLSEFLETQLLHVDWIQKSDPNLHRQMANAIANARNYIGSQPNLQQYLDQAFLNFRWPLSNSPYGEFIDKLRREAPAEALVLINFTFRVIGPDFGNWQHVRALGKLVAFDQMLSQTSVEAAHASYRRAVLGFQRQEAASRSQGTRFVNMIERAEQRGSNLLAIAKRISKRRYVRQLGRDSLRHENIMEDMASVKALYMEHMALEAPVAYWKNKSGSHKAASETMRGLLIAYAILGTAAIIGVLFFIFHQSLAVAAEGKPVSVLLILATMGVVVTTIAFWAGRILTRLYLSELHLSIDAGERATMVETYLALTKVNQASKEDRAIILASLFRPTADGIVKDDAAPELSPAGMISRIMTPG